MGKLLVVFGATGNQGVSVINKILGDTMLSEMFDIRAITRDPTNPKALLLKDKGVEVLKGELNENLSITEAVKGAHTVFAATVSNYGPNGIQSEIQQGKSLVDAAVSAGVENFIWSTNINATYISSGKIPVPQFDAKAEVEDYIRHQKINGFFYAPAGFMQNFLTFSKPSRLDNDNYAIFGLLDPDTPHPLIDIEKDTGNFVAAFLEDPKKYEGKLLAGASKLYSLKDLAQLVSKLTGKSVTYVRITEEEFSKALPAPVAGPLASMFNLMNDFGYYGPETKNLVEWSVKQARGRLTTTEEFFSKNSPL